MFCDKCGTALQPGQHFCPACGKEIFGGTQWAQLRRGRVGAHIRLLGILWLAVSAFNTVGGLAILLVAKPVLWHLRELGQGPPEFAWGFIQPLLTLVAIFFLSKALLGFAAGWGLLRREGWAVNRKRVYRIYREEALSVRRRRRKQVAAAPRQAMPLPTRSNERWSLDFMADTLADGRTFRTLNIVDDFTREAIAIEVGRSIPGARVVRVLERLARARAVPRALVLDNGPEFTSRALDQWAYRSGVELGFIQPGKPVQNAFVESFNGKFRDECLNQSWFVSLADAIRSIAAWRLDYNRHRPHSALNNLTPEEFAQRAA